MWLGILPTQEESKTMVRSDSRSPTMSLGRSVARVRVTSPSLKRKPASSCIRNDQEVKFLGDKPEDTNFRINAAAAGAEYDGGNKVMVVADSSMEAKGALDWALSHTIQPQDTIVLLHVGKPRKRVEGAKQLKVSLLVLGQRKKSIIWRLMRRLTAKRGGVVDYCIQNASCMTIAVRRKSNQLGGYLITTKRHKKFWLLA
ncbi:Endoplasmic reticulum-adenine nucleotide transporter 1 [Hibiscus syriacus]|uniref:Endoplasmic reticulum-adenine nucleotide transporter 1 n=1 Tax=Hibiscus syriacus TaxID=106335 RepID=A0A6A2Z540_HIBSY|nr:Endoplasmic reticulum-adenine nucleotide transporter 1 [Hibiscus syriacus]